MILFYPIRKGKYNFIRTIDSRFVKCPKVPLFVNYIGARAWIERDLATSLKYFYDMEGTCIK